MSPNVPDPNTYTPMYRSRVCSLGVFAHSLPQARSRFLRASECPRIPHFPRYVTVINHRTLPNRRCTGGDVNVTDNDGDTPLYVVENLETARFLVEHGATINRQNDEGISVRETLDSVRTQ